MSLYRGRLYKDSPRGWNGSKACHGAMAEIRARQPARIRNLAGWRDPGFSGRHVRRPHCHRPERSLVAGARPHAVRSKQDDLPVEQFSRACGKARIAGPGRAALSAQSPERLCRAWRHHPSAEVLCGQGGLRGRARHRHRPALLLCQRGRGARPYLRVFLHQRRHRRRSYRQDARVSPMDARQELRRRLAHSDR